MTDRRQYYLDHKDEIIARAKQNYLANKEKRLAYIAEWRNNNRDKVRQYSCKYMRSEKGLISAKKYRDNHKEIISERQKREKYKLSRTRYYRKNYDIIQVRKKEYFKRYKNTDTYKYSRQNQRHLRDKRIQENGIIDITYKDILILKSNTKNCTLCNKRMINKPYRKNSKELDHIKPICIGGTHTFDNVRIVCKECNLKRPKYGQDLIKYKKVI